jgi:hypothetical protein
MNADRGERIDTLLEMAASAFRESDASGRVLPSAAWFDLSPQERERLFDLQAESRLLERVIDPDGMSATARAVTNRIRGMSQLS